MRYLTNIVAHSVDLINNAGHKDAIGARCFEGSYHRAEILRFYVVTLWVRNWCGITYAKLIDIEIANSDPILCQLRKELPPYCGFTDTTRTAQP